MAAKRTTMERLARDDPAGLLALALAQRARSRWWHRLTGSWPAGRRPADAAPADLLRVLAWVLALRGARVGPAELEAAGRLLGRGTYITAAGYLVLPGPGREEG
jgi:hypothetical protein